MTDTKAPPEQAEIRRLAQGPLTTNGNPRDRWLKRITTVNYPAIYSAN